MPELIRETPEKRRRISAGNTNFYAEIEDKNSLIVYRIGMEEGEPSFFPGGYNLVTVPCENWERDLSPWQAPRAFRGGEDFTGGADDFLRRLCEAIPALEAELGVTPCERMIAGYSLAGLFSLYALYKTDLFSRAASASGSLWYDGFLAFAEKTPFAGEVRGIALSVGDREKETKNPRMRSVEDDTRAYAALCRTRGVAVDFTLNPGGHFSDPDRRLLSVIHAALRLDLTLK